MNIFMKKYIYENYYYINASNLFGTVTFFLYIM